MPSSTASIPDHCSPVHPKNVVWSIISAKTGYLTWSLSIWPFGTIKCLPHLHSDIMTNCNWWNSAKTTISKYKWNQDDFHGPATFYEFAALMTYLCKDLFYTKNKETITYCNWWNSRKKSPILSWKKSSSMVPSHLMFKQSLHSTKNMCNVSHLTENIFNIMPNGGATGRKITWV